MVQRQFTAAVADQVWFTDITQHRAVDGWVYCCTVLNVFSHKVVGWTIATHARSELVVDAPEMALRQRRPDGTTVRADRDAQHKY